LTDALRDPVNPLENDSSPSTSGGSQGTESVRVATVDLTVTGRRLRLELNVPTGPTRPVDLLPMFRSLTDTFVRIAVENAQADGATISCAKGCGACCRQLVPISEVEVESIRKLVGELPAPRRREIVDRFESALRRLEASGLLESLRTPGRIPGEQIRSLGTAYFAQRIPCPFLEDESCSIHPDRPLACREYLVTSPAAHCAKPSAESVRCVAMPVKVSRAVRHLDTGKPHGSATWIPMILALEWPLADPGGAQAPTGTASVVTLFEKLTGAAIPKPD
jgi:Fe-S-cluster containining protein